MHGRLDKIQQAVTRHQAMVSDLAQAGLETLDQAAQLVTDCIDYSLSSQIVYECDH